MDEAHRVPRGIEGPARDVGQEHHLVSAERARDRSRRLVGVDVVRAALAVGAVYAVVLFGTAAVSSDRTLPVGDRKVFCEIDCHLAYSIASATSRGSPSCRA